MILKTYLKKEGLVLSSKQQSHLGLNVAKCYFSRNPDMEIKKVSISSDGNKMLVNDYPRDFFNEKHFLETLNRFLKKHNIRKQTIKKNAFLHKR